MFESFNLSMYYIIKSYIIGLIGFNNEVFSTEKIITFYNKIIKDEIIILYCKKYDNKIIIEDSSELFSFLEFCTGKSYILLKENSQRIYWSDLSSKEKTKVLNFKILIINKF